MEPFFIDPSCSESLTLEPSLARWKKCARQRANFDAAKNLLTVGFLIVFMIIFIAMWGRNWFFIAPISIVIFIILAKILYNIGTSNLYSEYAWRDFKQKMLLNNPDIKDDKIFDNYDSQTPERQAELKTLWIDTERKARQWGLQDRTVSAMEMSAARPLVGAPSFTSSTSASLGAGFGSGIGNSLGIGVGNFLSSKLDSFAAKRSPK